MRRRAFIAGLVCTAALSRAEAQQAGKVYRIAIAHPSYPVSEMNEASDRLPWFPAFFAELRRLGYIEGQNLRVERYSAEGRTAQYADLAREVVGRRPDVILSGKNEMILLLKAATLTMPIVGISADPVQVGADHGRGRSFRDQPPRIDENRPVTQLLDHRHVVADEQHGATVMDHVMHLGDALVLETDVANGQYLIGNQYVRAQMHRDSKSEADIHAARIVLHRRVDERTHLGKIDDLVKTRGYFGTAHSQEGTVEKDVVPAAEIGMEAGADLKQSADSPAHLGLSFCWLGDARENFQQRALASPIGADDSEGSPFRHAERNVAKGPERLPRAEKAPLCLAAAVSLPQCLDFDDRRVHTV